MLSVFLDCSPWYRLSQASSFHPELASSASLASQLAQGLSCLYLLRTVSTDGPHLPRMYTGAGTHPCLQTISPAQYLPASSEFSPS